LTSFATIKVSRTKTIPNVTKITEPPISPSSMSVTMPAMPRKKEKLKPTMYTTATISLLRDAKKII